MGAKFANLQVFSNDIDMVKNIVPQNTVIQLSENWITIVGAEIVWGTAQKEAKTFSKVLPCPILCTEYFDDDYVEISVYKTGKCIAKHIPVSYESFKRKVGKPIQFIEAFGMNAESEKDLKIIFQERDPETCVHLLECIFKCILWVDIESIHSVRLPELTYLTEYLENKKKKQAIKNATKLVLLDEVAGDFDDEVTYPIVRYETPEGERKSVWAITSDNHLFKLFQTEIKGRIVTNGANVNSDKNFLLTVNEWSPQSTTTVMYTYDYNGNILNKFTCEDNIPHKASLLSEDLLFYNGKCYDVDTHQIKWDLNLGKIHYGIERVCRLSESKYAVVYDLNYNDVEQTYLSIFSEDGVILHSVKLPSVYHWEFPIEYKGNIFISCGVSRNESILYCYDNELNEQWSISYSGIYHRAMPLMDEENNTLYFQATASLIFALDMNTHKIIAKRNISDEYAMLLDVLPGVGLVTVTGDKNFEVWNRELQTISRHRTKGNIMRMVHIKDKHYILSNRQGDWESMDNADKYHTGAIQLYEII